jgi:uncharacterized membrane protein
MNSLAEMLLLLSTASLGIFAGAMLTEGFVLVSFWRSLAPAAVLDWYAANDRRLLAFFSPLTVVTVLLAIAAAVACWFADGAAFGLAATAALLAGVALATFFLYFGRANKSFATASIDAVAVAAELTRWAAWHWFRTAISVAAFAASLLALR